MQQAARQTVKQPACAGSRPPGRIARVPQRVKCQAPAGTAVAAPPVTNSKPQLLQRHQRLHEPAQIGAEGSSTVNVKDLSYTVVNSSRVEEDISLEAYMRLPVEQYYILDPSQIQFLSGNTFVLSVPKINLLTATLQPVITVQVTSAQDAVVLQAVDCQLNATGTLGDLDSKFAMQFTTKLTWRSQPHRHLSHHHHQQHQQEQHVEQQHPQGNSPHSNGSSQGLSAAGHQIRNGWNKLKSLGRPGSHSSSNGSGGPVSQQGASSSSTPAAAAHPSSTPGSITGTGTVKVWCEVVPPFHLMPKHVLESSCNVVISGLVNSLLPWFMRQLAADYQKWATDEKYRAERRQRTVAKQQQQWHRHQDALQ